MPPVGFTNKGIKMKTQNIEDLKIKQKVKAYKWPSTRTPATKGLPRTIAEHMGIS